MNSSTKVMRVTAREFLNSDQQPEHLDLWQMDVFEYELLDYEGWERVRTLSLSRLRLSGDFVGKLMMSGRLKNLRWLNLSGNPGVDLEAVQTIAEAIHSKKLGHLVWLDLLACRCDAMPYIDGSVWRISSHAKYIAKRFEMQKWMMFGSRNPKDENREILSSEQLGSGCVVPRYEVHLL